MAMIPNSTGGQQVADSGRDSERDGGNAVKQSKASYANLYNKTQLFMLCLARLAEPLAATSIQSYMFYQLKFFDPSAPDSRISMQAGLLTGAKTAAQVCTGLFWGRIADSDWAGRKVVLVTGLLSSAIAVTGYGLSTTFAFAIVWQVIGGAMNSNVSMVRCVVAEMFPEKRFRARALTLLPLCANTGMLVGPLLGGLLSSQPGIDIKTPYPYLLPNICIAVMYVTSALGVAFIVNETLPTYNREQSIVRKATEWLRVMQARMLGRVRTRDIRYSAVSSDPPEGPEDAETPTDSEHQRPAEPVSEAPKPRWRDIWTFNVSCTMLSHFIISGHLGTFAALWTVFLSTPIEDMTESADGGPPFRFGGGLGFQPRNVGFVMSAFGAITVFLQAVIYPQISDRFGTLKVWSVALYAFPIAYFCAPFPALIASEQTMDQTFRPEWIAVAGVLIVFGIGRTGTTPATTMLINDCSPHPSLRATIHTTATMIGNLSRSIFPVAALAIFGVGLRIHIVGLAFWCLTGLALLSCVASRFVKDNTQDDLGDHRA